MTLSPGAALGRYRIVEPIGRGGMGQVWKAVDTRFDRTVAIKAMVDGTDSDPDRLRRFHQELSDAPRIVHPYVATVFDVVEHETTPLLVMEYVQGRRLDDLTRAGALPPAVVARYGQEIAEALEAIHRAGLVHRDLKPGNVMVTDHDHVKVMDFGIALRSRPPARTDATTQPLSDRMTRPGAVVGTVAYMSPEQLRDGPVDPRSDLFALGVLLFEALAREHPFAAGTAAATAAAILHEAPGTEPARRLVAETGSLGDTILHLLQKDPASRPGTAREVAGRLREASREQSAPRAIPAPQPAERPRLRTAGWTALALLPMVLAAYAVWRAAGPPAGGVKREAAPRERAVVAVLPFESRMGAEEDLGAMVSDLLSATLGESGGLRPLPAERMALALAGMAAGTAGAGEAPDRVARVRAALAPDWIVTGTLYREQQDLLATVEAVRTAEGEPPLRFHVKAGRGSELALRAASRLLEMTQSGAGHADTPVHPAPRFATIDEAQALLADARVLAARAEYGGAIGQLEKACSIDPGFLDAHVLLAELLWKIGREARARETIQLALRLADDQRLPPDSRQALQARAMHGRILALPSGRASMEKLATLYPDEPDTLLQLASWRSDAGDYEKALEAADRAAELDTLDPRPLVSRAQILIGLGRMDEAREALAQAVRRYEALAIPGGLAQAVESQAYLAFVEKRYQDAGVLYARARDLFAEAGLPSRALTDVQSVADMSLMLWRLDDAEAGYREALAGLQRAGHYSQVVQTLSGLGGLLLRAGKMEEAERTLLSAEDEAGKLGDERLRLAPMINRAWVLCLSGRPQEAGRLATAAGEIARAAKDRRFEASSRTAQALAARQQGRYDEAARILQEQAKAEEAGGTPFRRAVMLGQLAEVQELAERPAAALSSIGQAMKLLEGLPPGVEHAFRIGCHARLLALVGRLEMAGKDRDRADAMAQVYLAAPQVRDMLARTAMAVALSSGDAAGLARAVPPAPRGDPRGTFDRGPVAALRAEALLERGRVKEAWLAATAAREHPWASPWDRAAAGLVEARSLMKLKRRPEALVRAREALEAARGLGMPLTGSKAAVLLLEMSPNLPEAASIREESRRALASYLDGLPAEDAASVRARPDVRALLEFLQSPPPPMEAL